jgi:serine/threonine-protein kinase
MPLTTGTRLGVYDIVSILGAGGMGEVYRARDSRLGREVAIKVILDVFAADPDRIARFEREAKVLASLNHPHIAALYGMEQSGQQHYLVMELVEGQTVADRLLRGPLPLEETVAIALQIADALEAAHEKGIVHRDLKPANIKVTPDDRVKVLDFGLAKAMENESAAANVSNSPTLSMMASQAGIILGTAAYMSPEQAKGFPADHRSDIFSFGSVLYEMLTGRQPFHGDTAPEVLASVLVREADISRLPRNLNPRIVELVRRCLEKQPKRRWQAIGDVRAELEAIAAAPGSERVAVQGVLPTRPLWRRALPVVAAALLTGALAAIAAWTLKPAEPGPVARFVVRLPAGQRFTGTGRRVVAISPDGATIVYVANNRLFVKAIGELAASPVADTGATQTLTSPAFSPDSRSLVFYSGSDGALKRVALGGGAAARLCPATNPMGLSWSEAGILFAQAGIDRHSSIMRVSAAGGTPETLVSLKDDEIAEGPQLLADGDTLLFTLAHGFSGADRWDRAQVVAQSLKSGRRTTLVDGGSDGRYLPSGHLAYARAGTVFAAPFDSRRLVTGVAFPILEGVRRASAASTGMADFSVARNGALAYVPGPISVSSTQNQLAASDRQGNLSVLKLTPGPYQVPRASPDGTRAAFVSEEGTEPFVAVYELSGASAMRRLTFGGKGNYPVWSADSKRVAYQSSREGDLGIFWQAADGTGSAERLTTSGAGEEHIPQSWSPASDVLLFDVVKGASVSLWAFSLKDRKLVPFGAVRSSAPTSAVFSPDGHWVAYATTENGAAYTYVQPFPATGARNLLVRPGGGGPHHPLWSPDGKELFYVPAPGVFESVSVTTQPTFAFGNPQPVPRAFQAGPPAVERVYDMLPDGRFLGLVTAGQINSPNAANPDSSGEEIVIVLNWFEELKKKIPGR